jgi:hypothetical protein
MKFLRLTFLIALIGGLSFMTSCNKGSDPEPSVEEAQLKLLSKTWTVSQVKFGPGNTDVTADYTSPNPMKLTIGGTFNSAPGTTYTYSLTGRPASPKKSPWPASGTWKFDTNAPETLIIRTEDNLQISYTVTASQLQLIFTYAGPGYTGRTSAVEGNWTFLFTPTP